MIQEYLFVEQDKREEVEAYIPKKVIRNIYEIENTNNWIVTYSTHGENEIEAGILSNINEYILNNFNTIVLTNESAAYYNKIIFPYVNAFERKLRKFLYLTISSNIGEGVNDNINDLENKDLGEIFTLLFADANFSNEVRAAIKNKSWQFTKKEILFQLCKIEENTFWDKIIGEEVVTYLRKEYINVKNYRNDVMHAHNISAKTFKEAKKLFIKINEQLDSEICKILEKNNTHKSEIDFNKALEEAMTKYKKASKSNSTRVIMTPGIEYVYSTVNSPLD